MVRKSIVSVFAVLTIVAGGFVLAPSAGAIDTGTATVVPSPNVAGSPNSLNSVSCLSSTNCTAVGSYTNDSYVSQTLVMTWDGTSWSTVTSPNTGAHHNYLNSVACVSSTFCTAVGKYDLGTSLNRTLAMTWNGSVWSIVSSPNPGTNDDALNSVSCASSMFCTAVGQYNSGGAGQTLIATWDGTGWSNVSGPNPGNANNQLDSVSCLTSSDCTAVGSFNNSAGNRTLVATWNGTSWSTVSSPNTPGIHNFLNSVSCTSSSFCAAVGYALSGGIWQTLAMAWDGNAWTIVTSPNIGANNNYLNSVSCTSSTFCIAIGYIEASPSQSLSMTWNGTTWATASNTNLGTGDNQLKSVSCTSSTFCTSIGYSVDGVQVTLVLSWNGTSWATVTSPNKGTNGSLNSVSCVSSTFCTAVGSYSTWGSLRTLAMTWDGSAWTTAATPNPGLVGDNKLTSVTCTSPTFCTAVGYYFDYISNALQTLVMTFNGSTWSIVTSPNTGSNGNALKSVTCTSPTFCAAVGYFETDSLVSQPLGMVWDGTDWTINSLPDTGGYSTELLSISCSIESSCSAVGNSSLASGINQTLVITWNGTGITKADSPNIGAGDNVLKSVSCRSSTFCSAVGWYADSGVPKTLAMTWNGSVWATVSSPNGNAGAIGNYLSSVSCIDSTSCTAVGYYYNASWVLNTLVMTWNGTVWTIMTSPNVGVGFNFLNSVVCTSSTSCTAGGSYSDGSANQTLAMAIVPPVAFAAPSAPTALVATVGNMTVSIAFTPGAAGSSAITKYQYTTNDGSSWADVTSVGTSSPVTISGLTNYVVYSIKIRAFSTAGGTASSAVSVETKNAAPTFTSVYSARVNGYAFRGISAAYTRVTPPTGTMVSYQITAYARGTNTVISSCTAKATWERCFIYGLTTGTQYDVRVKGLLKLPATPLVTRTTLESNYVTIRV